MWNRSVYSDQGISTLLRKLGYGPAINRVEALEKLRQMTRSNKILMSIIAATALIIVTAILILASPRGQALLIKIRLEKDAFGSSEERPGLLPLPHQLIRPFTASDHVHRDAYGDR